MQVSNERKQAEWRRITGTWGHKGMRTFRSTPYRIDTFSTWVLGTPPISADMDIKHCTGRWTTRWGRKRMAPGSSLNLFNQHPPRRSVTHQLLLASRSSSSCIATPGIPLFSSCRHLAGDLSYTPVVRLGGATAVYFSCPPDILNWTGASIKSKSSRVPRRHNANVNSWAAYCGILHWSQLYTFSEVSEVASKYHDLITGFNENCWFIQHNMSKIYSPNQSRIIHCFTFRPRRIWRFNFSKPADEENNLGRYKYHMCNSDPTLR
jgi:hypothetical protein